MFFLSKQALSGHQRKQNSCIANCRMNALIVGHTSAENTSRLQLWVLGPCFNFAVAQETPYTLKVPAYRW